ncbi:C2 domain containing protein [Blumeria hordei DH14]|uniref:C2 domain containing protein n=1 Tax=Blumeria graminis f. sp. hordei (strain DH14) TaxID=546991 RepID=N1JB10_BLUG1|nr:C2 domain containing protein [Blumeria hordei DH14]
MPNKMKLHGLNTMHTSGIFSDMTVDGPEIGTLVVIVDRAKNLPNRKTIGKQNPYCAARLGKEAKKTETDHRGGQTPKWDQELRYTVHDSPDYYNLKVSVFNDDKKTDLIGETWVDLKEVIVPGGGQNDIWHNLSCKGKYAGEIRIEITYYDTRPKQEKVEKTKQTPTNGHESVNKAQVSSGQRQPKSTVKRRPLPSDPTTGETTTNFTTNISERSSRRQPPPDLVTSETGLASFQPKASDFAQSPSRLVLEPDQNSYRDYRESLNSVQDYSHSPRDSQEPSPTAAHRYSTRVQQRNQRLNPQCPSQQSQVPENLYNPRYSTKHYGEYTNPQESTTSVNLVQNDRYKEQELISRNDYTQNMGINWTGMIKDNNSQEQYIPRNVTYQIPTSEHLDASPPSPDGPPPPPPIHRSMNTHGVAGHSSPVVTPRRSYVFPAGISVSPSYASPNSDSNFPPQVNERNSSYQAYSPQRDQEKYQPSPNGSYQGSPTQHHSYNSRYDGSSSMQPTVEDAPPSPSSGRYYSHRKNSEFRPPPCKNNKCEQIVAPIPRRLGNRQSFSSERRGSSSGSSQQYSKSSNDLSSINSRMSYIDRSAETSDSSRPGSKTSACQESRLRGQFEHHGHERANYGMPKVPVTLVPGMDPAIAQEIADRIYDEKRNNAWATSENSSQSRHKNPIQQEHAQARNIYNDSLSEHGKHKNRTSNVDLPMHKSGTTSSEARRTQTNRKSVSPSPIRPGAQRMNSGVPFGPESYNALNPNMSNSASNTCLSAAYNTNTKDEAKIITPDGREIDPSDHIPESNYAPLLESRSSKKPSHMSDQNYKQHSSSQPPTAVNGRRPLQRITRPPITSTSSAPHTSANYVATNSVAHPNRTRLQKISTRISANQVQQLPTRGIKSTYAENPQDMYYTNQPEFVSTHGSNSLPRAHTMEYQSADNYTMQNYGVRTGANGYGFPDSACTVGSGTEQWSLSDEMRKIDLYSGRASSRG